MKCGILIVMFYRLLAVCMIMLLPLPVQAGWLDFLFPAAPRHEGPHPAETLRAPFADEDAVVEDLDDTGESRQMTPLHLRHRTNGIMTLWVQQTLPMFLTYQAKTYEQHYADTIKNFSQDGAREYTRFLSQKNVLTTLKSGTYDVAGVLQDYPVIINEGAVDNRYRWLYQVKIMVTFLRSGTTDYKNVNDNDVISRSYTLTLQLGRSKEADNEHGVFIESWSVKDAK